MPVKVIARRLHLATSKCATFCLHTAVRASAPADAAQGRLGICGKTHHVMVTPFSLVVTVDRQDLIKTLAEVCRKIGCQDDIDITRRRRKLFR